MIHLTINSNDVNGKLFYSASNKTFYGNEREISFATEYKIINNTTNQSKIFTFSYSTGPEFHPDTKYVYICEDLRLVIANDKIITEQRAQAYLNHKIRN